MKKGQKQGLTERPGSGGPGSVLEKTQHFRSSGCLLDTVVYYIELIRSRARYCTQLSKEMGFMGQMNMEGQFQQRGSLQM